MFLEFDGADATISGSDSAWASVVVGLRIGSTSESSLGMDPTLVEPVEERVTLA